jgi:hypothetical protein
MLDLSKVERVILPNKRVSENKFIQLYVCGEPFFRFGDNDSLHSILLLSFLEQLKIGYRFVADDNGCPAPSPKGEDYELVGAGMIEGGEREFVLYGKSRAYSRIKANQKHLDDLAIHLPERIKMEIRG